MDMMMHLWLFSLIFSCIGLVGFLVFDRVKQKGVIRRHLRKLSPINSSSHTTHVADRYKGLKRNSLQEKLIRLKEQAGVSMGLAKYLMLFMLPAIAIGVAILSISGQILIPLVVCIVIGLALPPLILGWKARRRKAKFISDFPDAIDSVVRAARTGLPLIDGFILLAQEAEEPIKGEFQHIIDMRQLGTSIPESVEGLVDRIECPETHFFVTVIQIQAMSGGSVAEALSNLSTVIRSRKRMREKVKSLAAEAKASAGIIGCLPFFIVGTMKFTSPEYIELLFVTSTGHMVMIGCVAWMAVGIGIMWKMINFEI